MSPDTLVHMANQIALNFAVQGESRALPQIAKHVNLFWDPRMRAGMAAHLDAGGEGLHPLALKALAEGLRRPAAPRPEYSHQPPSSCRREHRAARDVQSA